MKYMKKPLIALSVVAAFTSAGLAQADVVTVKTSGTIASGRDFLGIFGTAGANLAGLSFSQTISADLGQGYEPGFPSPNAHEFYVVNPGSATLTGSTTVAGHTYQWTVHDSRGAFALYNFYSSGIALNDQIYIGAGGNSVNRDQNGLNLYAENHVTSDSRAWVSSLNPNQRLIPDNLSGLENYSNFAAQSYTLGRGTFFDSSRTVTSIALNPVPEPESWAMMVLGLGVLGALARRRAKQAVQS
ncbi:MAG: hypothetical protein RL748_3907 [Pseudomonadota bacterium]